MSMKYTTGLNILLSVFIRMAISVNVTWEFQTKMPSQTSHSGVSLTLSNVNRLTITILKT